MRNQSIDVGATDTETSNRAPVSDQGAEQRAVAEPRAAVPDWARAFGDTLPVIAGRGEARAWPRVIP